MVEIACDRKGTHALQALIALINRDVEEDLLRDTLKDHIVELSFVEPLYYSILKLLGSSRNSSYPKIDCIYLTQQYFLCLRAFGETFC